jgi:MFS family permease
MTLGGSSMPAAAGCTSPRASAVMTLPAGTLLFRSGLPAVLGLRGLLTFAFFGALAFFPLALELVRGLTATVAGIGVSIGSIGWTTGSWLQAGLDYRYGAGARSRIMLCGLLLLAIGIAGTASALVRSSPVGIAVAFWGLAGLEMGIAYNTDTVLIIQSDSEDSAGTVSSSMQLTDSLGQALGTGFGGGAMTPATWAAWGTPSAIAITFALSVAVCALAMALSPRLPSAGSHACGGSRVLANPAAAEPAEPQNRTSNAPRRGWRRSNSAGRDGPRRLGKACRRK